MSWIVVVIIVVVIVALMARSKSCEKDGDCGANQVCKEAKCVAAAAPPRGRQTAACRIDSVTKIGEAVVLRGSFPYPVREVIFEPRYENGSATKTIREVTRTPTQITIEEASINGYRLTALTVTVHMFGCSTAPFSADPSPFVYRE